MLRQNRPSFLSVICTILFMAAMPAMTSAAEARDMRLEYRAQWGNVNLALSEARWQFSDTDYSLTSTTQSKGSLAFAFKFEGEVRLKGQIIDGQHQPLQLFSGSTGKRGVWTADTSWQTDGQLIGTERDPELDLEEVFPLDPETLDGTIDPYSAMLNALTALQETGSCAGSWALYDGRRRTDMHLHDMGETDVKSDRPWAYAGKAHICGVDTKPLGGHMRESRWRSEDEDPNRVKVYIAQFAPDLLIPVRIEIDGFLGDVIVRLNVRDSDF